MEKIILNKKADIPYFKDFLESIENLKIYALDRLYSQSSKEVEEKEGNSKIISNEFSLETRGIYHIEFEQDEEKYEVSLICEGGNHLSKTKTRDIKINALGNKKSISEIEKIILDNLE